MIHLFGYLAHVCFTHVINVNLKEHPSIGTLWRQCCFIKISRQQTLQKQWLNGKTIFLGCLEFLCRHIEHSYLNLQRRFTIECFLGFPSWTKIGDFQNVQSWMFFVCFLNVHLPVGWVILVDLGRNYCFPIHFEFGSTNFSLDLLKEPSLDSAKI